MVIKNCKIIYQDKIEEGSILIKDGKIEKINPEDFKGEVLDAKGLYLSPGFIDVHIHGAGGYDTMDGTVEALNTIAKVIVEHGTTSFLPTTMTVSTEEINKAMKVIKKLKEEGTDGANVLGAHLEGPFISPIKKGAQDERNIIPCNEEIAQRFLDSSDHLVKFLGIAPEESANAVSFIKNMKDKVNISLAHTNASYEIAKEALEAGANHVVHLFNAMTGFTHREPGVVGAASDNEHAMSEIICDGVHIHPSMIRAAFKMMGAERMIFISDSMRATGMPDGQYTLGGLDVKVTGNRATLVSDGALAGSVTNLADCMRTAVTQMGIPLETAVACATKNPAISLGIYEERGSISVGKKADILLLDQNLALKKVIKSGR